LGDILISKGLINSEQLKAALEEQHKTKEFLGAILLKRKLIKESDFLATLSEQFGMPLVNLGYKYIDWQFVKGFSPSLIIDNHCFPVEKDEWSVTIAITNPLDLWALKKSEEEAKGLRLRLVLVSEKEMNDAIERYRQYIQKDIPNMI